MSIEVMSLVWRADLPAMDKIVLLRLADFSDRQGANIFPSVGTVCRECGVSDRHVQRTISKYVSSGILILVAAGGGRHRPSEYRIDVEAVKRCHPVGVYDQEIAIESTETPTTCRGMSSQNPDTVSPFRGETPTATTRNPDTQSQNPDTVSPDPSVTVIEPVAAAASRARSGAVPTCETSDKPSEGAVPHEPGAVREAQAVGRKVLDLMGVMHDPRWFGNSSRVELWLRSGADPEEDIYPTVTRIMTQRGGQPPQTLKYFDAAIAEAVRDRTSTLTTATGGSSHGNHRHRSRPSDRIDTHDRRRAIAEVCVGGVDPG